MEVTNQLRDVIFRAVRKAYDVPQLVTVPLTDQTYLGIYITTGKRLMRVQIVSTETITAEQMDLVRSVWPQACGQPATLEEDEGRLKVAQWGFLLEKSEDESAGWLQRVKRRGESLVQAAQDAEIAGDLEAARQARLAYDRLWDQAEAVFFDRKGVGAFGVLLDGDPGGM